MLNGQNEKLLRGLLQMINDIITNKLTGIVSVIIAEAEDKLFHKFHTVVSKDSNGNLYWFNPYSLVAEENTHEGPGNWVYKGLSY